MKKKKKKEITVDQHIGDIWKKKWLDKKYSLFMYRIDIVMNSQDTVQKGIADALYYQSIE